MDFIVASGLVTLVGLLLLARKHQFELTGTIKSRAIVAAALFAAGPLVQTIGVAAAEDRDAAAVFMFVGCALAGAAWLLIILNLLGVLTSAEKAQFHADARPEKPYTSQAASSQPGSVENGVNNEDSLDPDRESG